MGFLKYNVLRLQSFVKDVEDLGLHDSTTDRCRVTPRMGLPEDIKMPAWLKAYNKVPTHPSHAWSHLPATPVRGRRLRRWAGACEVGCSSAPIAFSAEFILARVDRNSHSAILNGSPYIRCIVYAEQGCGWVIEADQRGWAVLGSPHLPGAAHGRPQGAHQGRQPAGAAHHCRQHRLW